MHLCPQPDCQARGLVIRVYQASNGSRRRRLACSSCGHRWTAWEGVKPPRKPAPPASTRRQHPSLPPLLSEADVRLILTAHDRTLASLGREFGRSGEAIRCVRIGESYADVLPELPRWISGSRPSVSCHQCCHWEPGAPPSCAMGFPDPVDDGPLFAVECELFSPRPGGSRRALRR